MRSVRLSLLLVALLASAGTIRAQVETAGDAPAAPVRVSIEIDALPFSDLDANGHPTGFAVELLQAVAHAEGLRLEFDFRPWDEIMADFRAGRVQVLGNVASTPERDRIMDFSLPNFTMRSGFFRRRDGPPLSALADLQGRRVAVLRESYSHDYARAQQAAWQAEIIPVATHEEAIAALRDGRGDAFLAMILVTQYFLQTESVRDVVAALPAPDLNHQLHFAVQEGDAALLRRLNEGLLAVHRDGTYDRLYEKWLGPLEPRRLGLRDLQPYARPALLVLGLIAAAFVWQRRLLIRVSRQAEAVRQSEERLQLVFAATEDGFWDWDVSTGRVERSPRVARMLGYQPDELPAHPRALLELLHPEDAPALGARLQDLAAGRIEHFSLECRVRAKSGDWRWILDRGKAVARDASGRALRVAGTVTDITARKESEAEGEKLRQKMLEAQKLESLGVLAGGVAHDFNNVLTVVLGNAALTQLEPGLSRDTAERLGKIQSAATRAADLCRQLLAYAGRGAFSVEQVRVNELVQETTRLLEVTINRRATLEFSLAPDLPAVEADPSQVWQLVMNLVNNAAESMPPRGGGRIRLATSVRQLAAGEPAHALPGDGLAAGTYVCIEVEDTGSGIPPENRGRIFDPFFTTKAAGRGLGLPAVLGIVRSHRGALQVESEVGRGSTFRVFLPAAAGAPLFV